MVRVFRDLTEEQIGEIIKTELENIFVIPIVAGNSGSGIIFKAWFKYHGISDTDKYKYKMTRYIGYCSENDFYNVVMLDEN